jgi:hypothetical protein
MNNLAPSQAKDLGEVVAHTSIPYYM